MPPLNYLRPFEATARLGSTVRAAEELGVTHSAVSRQIKLLEQWLDRKLFFRDSGRLLLTPKGREYHTAVSHILNLLDRATGSITNEGKEEQIIRIHSSSAFVSRWLIPRIDRFYRKFPNLDIWICDFSRNDQLTSDLCDVAVSTVPGYWPDMETIPLMPDLIFPVCNTERASRIHEDAALFEHKFLCSTDPFADWDNWLSKIGFSAHQQKREALIADLDLVLQYAASGHGVALARGQLVMDDLNSQKLARPLQYATKVDEAYWLIRPKYGRIKAAVRSFTGWLREEAALSSKRLIASFTAASILF